MCSVIIMHIIYSFWKASVELTASSFMLPQNCGCVIFTRGVETGWFPTTGLQAFDQNEWSAMSVFYIDWWLTDFLQFPSKDVALVLSDNMPFPDASLGWFSSIHLSLWSSWPILLLSAGCFLTFCPTLSLTVFTLHLKVYQLLFFTQVPHIWCCRTTRTQNVPHKWEKNRCNDSRLCMEDKIWKDKLPRWFDTGDYNQSINRKIIKS